MSEDELRGKLQEEKTRRRNAERREKYLREKINKEMKTFGLEDHADFKYYFKNECEGFIRFPNTRKHLKPRGRRPSGFIVFECLET